MEGHYAGEGPDALEAANSIMREMNIPYNGWDGGYEYTDSKTGENISQEEFDKKGGDFTASIYKDGKYYFATGTVNKSGKKWKSGGFVEDAGVD